MGDVTNSEDKHGGIRALGTLPEGKEFSGRTLKSTIFTNIISSSKYCYRTYQLWRSPHQPGGERILYRLVGRGRPALLGRFPEAGEDLAGA